MPTIKSEHWDAVTAPAIPAGWTVDSPLVTSTADGPTSTPNSLVYPVASGGAQALATWATADTNSGNVQVSATIRWVNAGSGAGEQDIWLFARGSAIAANANWGTTTAYVVYAYQNSGAFGLSLVKRVAGTNTHLVDVGTPAIFSSAVNYRLYLSCLGSTITVQCQRLSDGSWLTSSATWVADPTNSTVAAQATDTAIAAAAGYAGLGYYLENSAGGDVSSDDFLLETASRSLAVSPSSLVYGSGNQSVTLRGTNTNFSTTSSTQFTLSGGVGASIVSQHASGATLASLVINPGTGAGTLTLTDTTDGSITATIALAAVYALSISAASGQTVYYLLRNAQGQLYNSSTNAFEAYSSANYASYALALTEQGATGCYLASLPSGVSGQGRYTVQAKQQTGASAAVGDAQIGIAALRWGGSNEVDVLACADKSGYQVDLTQAIPTSNTAQTVGDALNAARAQGFGKWVLSGTTLTLYAHDGTSVVRTFTLDSATAPTTRT